MSSLSILFQAKSRVSHLSPLRNTTFSFEHSFRIFSPSRCSEHTISHGRKVALIPFVTPRPNGTPVTSHGDCKLAPQTNISLSNALWPYSCVPRKTSQEVTHPKITPHQTRLTMEFLAIKLYEKRCTLLLWVLYQSFFKLNLGYHNKKKIKKNVKTFIAKSTFAKGKDSI